ncbi:LysR family transcriptional regulator [Actinomycetospora cinnamomea]|uniref:DNA-binding transcriptional LysR family regulator n=1 Tax=Actinomycetospora cinnamomea TaxID=663609 RepID=A0A2U1F6B4_9PSEU|nr:LysR substrate-binding domain-containing protein [Actinomycetospora cinnamomea]PVZ07721.1 DNA-binding transcriptional LysR family regulator [Actinomycetospora cinnamomea]
METRQLRYFVAVAETRHFGRAAERLHIAQSPLSQAIRQLESQLGAPLFERTTRRVDLTAAGEALLPEAVRILASLDAARDQVGRVAAGALGRLRVGATGLATYRYVPDLVRRLADEAPGLELAFVTEMLTPALEAALADHRIDLAVLRAPVSDPAIARHVLAREHLVLAVPAGHRLAVESEGRPGCVPRSEGRPRCEDPAPTRLGDLADEDFVVYAPPGSVVGEAAARACRAAGFTPRRTHSADQTSIVLALVSAGAGVALLPSSVLAVGVAGVRYLEIDEPPSPGHDPVTTDVALAWRRDDPSPALARALAVLCRPDQPGATRP